MINSEGKRVYDKSAPLIGRNVEESEWWGGKEKIGRREGLQHGLFTRSRPTTRSSIREPPHITYPGNLQIDFGCIHCRD